MFKHSILFLFFVLCSSQLLGQHILSGTISSADRTSLIGASVFLEGTNIAGVTEDDGTYFIEDIPSGEYTIQYSYLGYDDYSTTILVDQDLVIDVKLLGAFYNLDEIQVSDSRLNTNSPFTYSEVTQEELKTKNTGVDMPFLLRGLTNVQTTSDAGHGIGYTSIRLRGSDQSRINVTVNGVPINDAESQSVFWVNMPDFASSVDNIQVQRGVGTSTNGPGAFGGTVGLNTHALNGDAYAELGGMVGSYNSNKLTIKLGSGILNDRFSIDGRYSIVNSDGYIDRGDAKLNSWMLSPAVYWDDAVLRLDIFSGHEVTNQAWWGVPEARLGDNQADIDNHFANNFYPGGIYQTTADSLNYYNSDRRYNYYLYDNQVDDYQQDHVQLHYYKNFSEQITSRFTGYYTHGFGFYEEYRIADDLAFYDLPTFLIEDDTLFTNDIIRRRSLDNTLFGFFTNNQISTSDRIVFDVGGGLSRYKGQHFGTVIEVVPFIPNFSVPYYTNDGVKLDYNAYIKSQYQLTDRISTLADLQLRGVGYTVAGNSNDARADNKIESIDYENNWLFFNPKLGVTYTADSLKAYASIAIGNREPDRNDILDALSLTAPPRHETLYNGELGFTKAFDQLGFSTNVYYMYYRDQLVLTGALNDVGASLRTNVDESYRAGIELEASTKIGNVLSLQANLALSQNKITQFNEILYNYTDVDVETIVNTFDDVDIAFSPSAIAWAEAKVHILESLDITIEGKYVGQQYLDNTQNEEKALPAYVVSNASVGFSPVINGFKNVDLRLHVNNLLNSLYSANGYTYSYGVSDFFITENFYYPQAERNFMLTATFKI